MKGVFNRIKEFFTKDRLICVLLFAFYAIVVIYFLYHEQFGWWFPENLFDSGPVLNG